ncbi:MAG: UDP-N-acetylglucosamine--N-acetylmuramyl-(pentapeptide) pyrophosphoryl-undecaprenol N-acetylglucosamine transferase [Oligoflexia bacterium]|nr:UDP-N-acetylglucosamine--N-acetylmuramyl-(pentapeptide) pyrophosphoryl-undecaprenol N-acetylglucosamine transferase [Oligoflexia bacterium]
MTTRLQSQPQTQSLSKNSNKKKRLAVLVSGGTAGHINTALALGEKFKDESIGTLYFTGKRHLDYKLHQGLNAVYLDSMPLKYKNPLKVISSIVKNLLSMMQVLFILMRQRPAVAIGAGGYVCGPVLLSAYLLRIPVYVIEQNAVLGLTNKILSLFSKKIFLHFKHTKGVPFFCLKKVVISGNPIRKDIVKFAKENLAQKPQRLLEKVIRVLVFGGSLGAKSINDCMIDFATRGKSISNLRGEYHLQLRHQTGREYKMEDDQKQALTKALAEGVLSYSQHEYFDDMAKEYSFADLIVCRSGASSISELRIVGVPVILIPYPHHKDRHQFYNARSLAEEALFPVYIEDCNGLQKDNFKRLCEILDTVWERKVNYDDQGSNKGDDSRRVILANLPEDIIFREIIRHV